MPLTGGYAPFPLRFGGGTSRVQTILQSLAAGYGDAYDTTTESNVFPLLMGKARAIAAAWATNGRTAYLWDPLRCPVEILARWETICGASPAASDTLAVRRGRVAGKLLASTGPTAQALSDMCAATLGGMFVGVEYTPLASANAHWAATGEPTLWASSIAHVLVRVVQPANLTTAAFLARMSQLLVALDQVLPAWCTSDWAIYGTGQTIAGFYLDETNLDFEAFDA